MTMEPRETAPSGAAVTRIDLCAQLRALGLEPGAALVVHAALGRIGWVAGGAESVIGALMAVLSPQGTLVMPTFSGQLGDPPAFREPLPPFDAARTPSRDMGALPETFRKLPGVHRSHHPVQSLAAWGRGARDLVANHGLDWPLGPDSPLGRLCELDGQVLLIGVGHDRNSTLHLAETRVRQRRAITRRVPVASDNGAIDWVEIDDVADDNGRLFPALGAAFEATGRIRIGPVGQAEARLMSQRALVDFAVPWFEAALGAT
jgi:aminoglycoside 3-N-acetyltransferase